MTEKTDAERIRELEATVARLEQERANAPDLEWLRNSHAWKRTEYWAHPRWHWAGAAMVVFMIALFSFGNWMAELKNRPVPDEPLEAGQVRRRPMPDGTVKLIYGPSTEDRKRLEQP